MGSAVCHGMSHLIGQVKVGCLADLVLYTPANFGARPEMVIKGGVIAWAHVCTLIFGKVEADERRWAMPMVPSPRCSPSLVAQCGAPRRLPHRSTRSSGSARRPWTMVSAWWDWLTIGTIAEYGVKKRVEAVKKCRDVGKKDMKHNDSMPKMIGEYRTRAC